MSCKWTQTQTKQNEEKGTWTKWEYKQKDGNHTKGQQNKLYEAEEYNSWTKKFNRELHTKVGKTKESFQKT